jgi:hypothetical protein
MNHIKFIKNLQALGWNFKEGTTQLQQTKDNENEVGEKIAKCETEFVEFISSFSLMANAEDNIWFLSIDEYYKENDGEGFAWNEFELQSLEYAEKDEEVKIKNFWKHHLPFLMSVKSGYAYCAIVLDGEDSGSIVAGNEPEYEETTKIAGSLEEFFDLYYDVLTMKSKIPALSMLV